MSLYDLPNATTGMDDIMIQLASEVPSFSPLLLAFIFFTIMIGGMVSQRKRSGYDDMPMWSTIAGIGTIVIALPLTVVAGIINITHLIVLVVVTLLSMFWLAMSKNKYGG